MKTRISNADPIPGYQESQEQMDPGSRIFVEKSLAISHYLQLLLRDRGLRQKDLADLLGKSEAEISKWLAGMHNYTLRSLSKLEAAIGSEIIFIPAKIENKEVVKHETKQGGSLRMSASRREEPVGVKELNYGDSMKSKIEAKNEGGLTLEAEAA